LKKNEYSETSDEEGPYNDDFEDCIFCCNVKNVYKCVNLNTATRHLQQYCVFSNTR